MNKSNFDLLDINEWALLQELFSEYSSKYTLKFRFNKYEHSRWIRQYISNLFKIYLSKIDLHRLKIIIDELINNAVEHSNNNFNFIEIKYNIWNKNIKLNIKVKDSWNDSGLKAKDILCYKDENNSNVCAIRWRWLFVIIDRIASDLKIKDNNLWGLTVSSKVKFKKI